MDRCTLCGGRLVNGRCVECGLDNNKNDKKYNLNTHNEKTAHFHAGACEDMLNKERPQLKKSLAREKVLRQRRQTGTVRTKKNRVVVIVIIIIILELASAMVSWVNEKKQSMDSEITLPWTTSQNIDFSFRP